MIFFNVGRRKDRNKEYYGLYSLSSKQRHLVTVELNKGSQLEHILDGYNFIFSKEKLQ